jgi:hypothetical protein
MLSRIFQVDFLAWRRRAMHPPLRTSVKVVADVDWEKSTLWKSTHSYRYRVRHPVVVSRRCVVGNEISSELLQRDLISPRQFRRAITEYCKYWVQQQQETTEVMNYMLLTLMECSRNHRCQLISKHSLYFFLCCTYDVVLSISLSIYIRYIRPQL